MGESPGVARERTTLAWHRTSLSVAVAVAVAARLQASTLHLLGLVGLGAAVVLAMTAVLVHGRPVAGGSRRAARRDGRGHLVLSASLALVAVVELATMASGG